MSVILTESAYESSKRITLTFPLSNEMVQQMWMYGQFMQQHTPQAADKNQQEEEVVQDENRYPRVPTIHSSCILVRNKNYYTS